MTNTTIEILYGEKVLQPIKYWISEKEIEVTAWYSPWRSVKTEYYLECEFSSLGPFDSVAEIRAMAARSGMRIE